MEKEDIQQLTEENQRLRRAIEELSILNEIALAISSSTSLENILENIVNKCTKHLKVEQVAVMLLDEKREEKPFQTMVRGWDSASNMMPYRLDTQLTGWMLKNRTPLLINKFQEDDRFLMGSKETIPIYSLLCVPLIYQARMIGLISVFNKKTNEGFTSEDQRLLSIISTQSAQIIENARLMEEEKALLKMQEELRLAYEIQINLLPKSMPKIPGYDIAGKSVPAKEVGGDYFDFISIDQQNFAFCLGDVSGKGMPAALLMSNLQAIVHGQIMANPDPAACLQNSNTMLFHNTTPEKFATFFYAILNPINHSLVYANAGHNFPFIITAKGEQRLLKENGIILGCMESFDFSQETLTMAPGDCLVIYSDGISEAVDPSGEEFGEDRLISVVKEHIEKGTVELTKKIIAIVQKHAGEHGQWDDITLVIVKRNR
jgi:serine phosphatase RsbU (regulator of sigma subunit)